MTCAEVRSEASSGQNPSFRGYSPVPEIQNPPSFPYQVFHNILLLFSSRKVKQNKTPLVEKKLKICYFLVNILSICKGFLSYSAFQVSPDSATWGVLVFYPVCVVNKQIKKICLSLGAGWRILCFYLLYLLLFKCLCFLATICIFFQSLLNMIRIYSCCLNSCVSKILLGQILWCIHECALQTTHTPGVCRVCSEPWHGILSSEESVYK